MGAAEHLPCSLRILCGTNCFSLPKILEESQWRTSNLSNATARWTDFTKMTTWSKNQKFTSILYALYVPPPSPDVSFIWMILTFPRVSNPAARTEYALVGWHASWRQWILSRNTTASQTRKVDLLSPDSWNMKYTQWNRIIYWAFILGLSLKFTQWLFTSMKLRSTFHNQIWEGQTAPFPVTKNCDFSGCNDTFRIIPVSLWYFTTKVSWWHVTLCQDSRLYAICTSIVLV